MKDLREHPNCVVRGGWDGVSCYAPDCDQAASVMSVTPWGRGAWCDEHSAEVVAPLGPDYVPFPAWVSEVFDEFGRRREPVGD